MSTVELFFEEMEENERIELARKRRRIRDASNPLELDDICFVENFRLPKPAFVDLLNDINEKLKPNVRVSSVPNIIKLAAVLRFCGQGSYQSSVGNDFNLGLAQPTVSLIMTEVMELLEDQICPKWIKFNLSDCEKNQAKLHFYEKCGIPGIIGCVDGTHVKIRAPNKNVQHLYYNRKGFYSLNVMVVCDHQMRIRYINAKYPGANHDSMVWNMSAIKHQLEQQYQSGERDTWLLGDAGYPLAPYLMTPFRNADEGSPQAYYNKKNSSGRIIVERTFGVLKNKFRCLLGARELHYSPEMATVIVNVCAALHNICLHYNGDPGEEIDIDDNLNDEYANDDIETNTTEMTINREEAENIRNSIVNSLSL